MIISALKSHFIPVIIVFYNRSLHETKAAQTSPKSSRSLDYANQLFSDLDECNINTFKTGLSFETRHAKKYPN